jgi:hypothetical protein
MCLLTWTEELALLLQLQLLLLQLQLLLLQLLLLLLLDNLFKQTQGLALLLQLLQISLLSQEDHQP